MRFWVAKDWIPVLRVVPTVMKKLSRSVLMSSEIYQLDKNISFSRLIFWGVFKCKTKSVKLLPAYICLLLIDFHNFSFSMRQLHQRTKSNNYLINLYQTSSNLFPCSLFAENAMSLSLSVKPFYFRGYNCK